jgi:hypothetical protein
MDVKIISLNSERILVQCPYHGPVAYRLKRYGKAKWSYTQNGWEIDAQFENEVKDILLKYFDTDGTYEPLTIDIEVIFNEEVEAWKRPVTFLGKTIAYAYNRDSGALVGDDVALIEGKITSGGSRANWTTIVKTGAHFRLKKVNNKLFELFTTKLNVDVTPNLPSQEKGGDKHAK